MPHKVKKVEKFKMNYEKVAVKIKEKAEEKGVCLKNRNGLIAIKLFEYTLKHGHLSEDEQSYWLFLTLDEMEKVLGYSRTAIWQTLLLLEQAEVIKRPHYVGNLVKFDKKNKATQIDCSFFDRVG